MMQYGIYRHKNCLDMDMVILKITYRSLDYIKAKVLYVNRRNHDHIFGKDTIKVNRADFENWQLVLAK